MAVDFEIRNDLEKRSLVGIDGLNERKQIVSELGNITNLIRRIEAKHEDEYRNLKKWERVKSPRSQVADERASARKQSSMVERLRDRVQSSTLLDDRRDAVRALRSLSKKFRLEVGTQAMDVIVNVLEVDRSDAEITGLALDTLCNVMSNEPLEEDEDFSNHIALPDDLGGQFTEIFIKKGDNITLLLSLMEEYDFHVRWPSVKLLTILLTNRSKELQECILVSPMGVSKLVDLLSDSREIIRNDALLLLTQLTKGNANIQKIVAFENAFEKLLDIIRDEGNSDGGIVVEDCLLLLLNLLKNNTSNQNFFKEGSFIQRIEPFFNLEDDTRTQAGWSAQKVTNIHLMLQVVRTLVSPNNPQQQILSSQKVMNQCGLLEQLCIILMASGVPADVLTETINTVSEVIRGNQMSQEYFASVMAPSNPPRPAIVVLLMSMVNEKQPFVLRCAVLYCFQSFLYKNDVGQSQIIQTLLPTTADVNTISAGQLLCGGLFSSDSLSNWFAGVAMLHAILRNNIQKEQLLRVQLATSVGNPPVSLLQQCCNILIQGAKFQTRIGLLQILCVWLADCPISVAHFLYNAANVPYLITQVSSSEGDEQELLTQGICAFLLGLCFIFNDDQSDNFNRASLKQIIEKRIGLETFTDKLSHISKIESFTRAAKKPYLSYKQSSEVIIDFEFTKLFKSFENDILKMVTSTESFEEMKKNNATIKEHESIVDQYKQLIKEQDEELTATKNSLENFKLLHSQAEKQTDELKQQVQQLKDQNAVLKTQKGVQNQLPNSTDNRTDEELSRLQDEIQLLRIQNVEKENQIGKLKNNLSIAEAKILAQVDDDENKENNPSETAVLQATVNQLNQEVEEYRKLATEKDRDLNNLRTEMQNLQQNSSFGASQNVDTELKMANLESDKATLTEEKMQLHERLKKSNEENLKLMDKIQKLEDEKNAINVDKASVMEELDTVKKEQDDLLVLLADQDAKVDKYKKRLKELGEEVEEDDDDDDDDIDEDDS